MGLDLGLEQYGIRADVTVEIEPIFCKTIQRNRPNVRSLQTDVNLLSGEDLVQRLHHRRRRDVDLMVGGPPCQSFSPGGLRAGLSDPRGNLILTYLRLIGEVRPRYFVLENVANLVTAALKHRSIDKRPGKNWNLAAYNRDQGRLFESEDGNPALLDEELSGSALRYLVEGPLAELGYSISFSVVNAHDYGAPQRRQRFVLIGSRDGQPPKFAQPTHGDPPLAPRATVKDAIGDIAHVEGPGSQYTAETAALFALVPPGGYWRNLPEDVARRAMGERSYAAGGGKTGFFRRLSWDEPSPTVTGKVNRKGSAMCHPEHDRPLNVRECARLQGFPDDWHFAGATDKQYLQIGNAVPVQLGAAVGATLQAALRNKAEPDTRSFEQMISDAHHEVRKAARNKRARPKK